MATVAAVAAVVSAVAGVASAVVQNRRAKKAAAEQRRQNEIQNRLARAEQARSVRRQVAQQRVEAAEFAQAGFQFGVPGSTSQQQAIGAGATDVATSIGAGQASLNVQALVAESQNRVSSIRSQFDPFRATSSIAGVFTNAQTNRAIQQQFA